MLAIPFVSALFLLLLFWLTPILLLVLIVADLVGISIVALMLVLGWRAGENKSNVATLAQRNSDKLQKYSGQRAYVTKGMGNESIGTAQIVKLHKNILVLSTVSEDLPTAATVLVDCKDLQIVEVPMGVCAVQIKLLAHHLNKIPLKPSETWESRRTLLATTRPRGRVAFHARFSRVGSPKRREILIYNPIEGNPDYTLVAFVDGKETTVLYGSNIEISKQFAMTQIDYRAAGFEYVGEETGASPDPLFLS